MIGSGGWLKLWVILLGTMETGAGAIWSQCTACPKPDQRWYGVRIGCGMAYKLVEQDVNFIELTVENNEGSDGGNNAIDCCEMRVALWVSWISA